MSTVIHPTAIVEAGAQLGADCEIQAHAIVRKHCVLGDRVTVHPFSVLGGDPQYLKFDSSLISGVRIGAGSFLFIVLGAANRDPAHWGDDADVVDLTRPGAAQHLAFGSGIHHCLGASLARLEARIALEELTSRYAALQLAAPPTRRPLLVLRGYESIPVRARQSSVGAIA